MAAQQSPSSGLPSKCSPFTAIYIDTNVLFPSWPHKVPAAAQQVFYWAKTLNVTIYLPAPVEAELEGHWKREHLRNIRDSADRLTQELRRFSLPFNWGELPSDGTLLKAYRSACDSQKIANGFVVSPLMQGTISVLLTDAVNHSFPFEDKGKNFQDAVILHSVMEHNAAQGAQPAAFLSRDKRDFGHSEFSELNKRYGSAIAYFSTEEKLEKELTSDAMNRLMEVWAANQSAAEAAIKRSWESVQHFLERTFIKSSDVRLTLRRIHEVKTFLLGKSGDGTIPLSFYADAEFLTAIGDTPPLRLERTVMITGSGQLRSSEFTDISLDAAELI